MSRLIPYLIFYVALLVGCAGGFLVTPYVEPDFKEYVNRFNVDYKKYAGKTIDKEITVVYGHLDPPTAGYCSVRTQMAGYNWVTTYKIVIDRDFWLDSPDCQKEILMYHELGHCALGRMHEEEPSVMEPYLITCGVYNDNKEFYLKELFGVE